MAFVVFGFAFVLFGRADPTIEVDLERLLKGDVDAHVGLELLGLPLEGRIVGLELPELGGDRPDEVLEQAHDEDAVVAALAEEALELREVVAGRQQDLQGRDDLSGRFPTFSCTQRKIVSAEFSIVKCRGEAPSADGLIIPSNLLFKEAQISVTI